MVDPSRRKTRYSVTSDGCVAGAPADEDCAAAGAAHAVSSDAQMTRRNHPVENMWMNGGKLVDILTRQKYFVGRWSCFPFCAACGCVFASPFACGPGARRAECFLPP